MTRSTQDKFRDLLDAECKARGLELIVNQEWANTGHYAIHGSALAPLLTIRYSWQTSGGQHWRGGGYVTLEPDRDVPGLHGEPGKSRAEHFADLDKVQRSILAMFAPTGGKLA